MAIPSTKYRHINNKNIVNKKGPFVCELYVVNTCPAAACVIKCL